MENHDLMRAGPENTSEKRFWLGSLIWIITKI